MLLLSSYTLQQEVGYPHAWPFRSCSKGTEGTAHLVYCALHPMLIALQSAHLPVLMLALLCLPLPLVHTWPYFVFRQSTCLLHCKACTACQGLHSRLLGVH